MNEQEFRERFLQEKELYSLWGEYIKNTLLEDSTICSLLKLPVKVRLKDMESLINKAFYRNKSYKNPYEEITDKVGLRFVVLLSEHITPICDLIKSISLWSYSEDRHFEDERDKQTDIFSYQSVHYVLTNIADFEYNGKIIPSGITCEVQIRTLLQHSYSELTHDTIYKTKISTRPLIHRKIARSMALIEATDELFCDVTNEINCKTKIINTYNHFLTEKYNLIATKKNLNTLEEFKLDDINTLILDNYFEFISEIQLDRIRIYIKEYFDIICDIICDNYHKNKFFKQPIILFLIYMVSEEKFNAGKTDILSLDILEEIANTLGFSIRNIYQ